MIFSSIWFLVELLSQITNYKVKLLFFRRKGKAVPNCQKFASTRLSSLSLSLLLVLGLRQRDQDQEDQGPKRPRPRPRPKPRRRHPIPRPRHPGPKPGAGLDRTGSDRMLSRQCILVLRRWWGGVTKKSFQLKKKLTIWGRLLNGVYRRYPTIAIYDRTGLDLTGQKRSVRAIPVKLRNLSYACSQRL